MFEPETLDGQLPVHDGDHDVAVHGCERPVHDQLVVDWVSNDNEHEGWAAVVALDGRLSSSSSREGMLIKGITGRYKPDMMLPEPTK